MRYLALFSLFGLAFTSCETSSILPELDDTGMNRAPTEQRGLGYVDIDEDWRLESEALTVTRDQSRHQVLRAAAQSGARLTSLRLPHHSQVPTNAMAEAIYYDAFQDRFELVGEPIIEQGSRVTRKYGPDARLVMYSDGTVLQETDESLVEGPAEDPK